MTRQPPMYVPRLIASAQLKMTQNGAFVPLATVWFAINANVMMPIVFWASLVPCANDTIDADPIWPIRKPCVRVFSLTP